MMWLYVSHIHINLILYIHKWMGHPWSWWRRHGHWGGWWNGRPGWWWHPWYGHPYWWWHGNHWRALGPLPSSVLTSTKHSRSVFYSHKIISAKLNSTNYKMFYTTTQYLELVCIT